MDVTVGKKGAHWHRGAAIVEAAIALPILIVVILAAIQFGFVYQAKATLNHAALLAARAGAVENASPTAIRRGLAQGLAPLRSPDSSLQGVSEAVARLDTELRTDARIRILNPTRDSFEDFASEVAGVRELPNDRLDVRSTEVGARGGLNIQDANLLRIEITYGYELKVPLVNGFLSRLSLATRSTADPFEQQLLRRSRLPITATATVRMQSPLRFSDLLVARADLPDVHRFVAGAGSANGSEDHNDEDATPGNTNSSPGSADGGHNLSEGFFGFGSATATPSNPSGRADSHHDDDDDGHDDGIGEPSDTPPDSGTTALCTPTNVTSSANENNGALAGVWQELRNLAGNAYEFVRGFWEGIRGQIGDLVATITDPIETARGIYELAMAFIEDPVATARTIGAALGHDLSQLVHCGAYDQGRVLGSYVSPAFMLKLATKLARFGRVGLLRAAEATKRELGCASFAADTLVWTDGRGVPIQSLQPGATVESRSERTYRDSSQLVTHTINRRATSYREVVTEGSHFAVSEEHPFWVQGRGWTPINEIEVGAPIATMGGDTLVLQNRRVDAALQVFNLTVANDESYFVGDEGVWAHNATCRIRIPYHRPRSPTNFAIGASDGGPGTWSSIPRPDNDAYRYQERITGAPRGVEYNVNGVNFDGYDAQRDVLLDAKHWTQECPLGDRCRSDGLKSIMAEKLLREAKSQLTATQAVETHIEWRVVDEEMALRISAILDGGIRDRTSRARITVIYTPLSDIEG